MTCLLPSFSGRHPCPYGFFRNQRRHGESAVEAGRKSLLGKAMARPDLVKQVLEYARSNGVKAARQKVQARLETLSALGYSCSGFVLEAEAGTGLAGRPRSLRRGRVCQPQRD